MAWLHSDLKSLMPHFKTDVSHVLTPETVSLLTSVSTLIEIYVQIKLNTCEHLT